MDQRWRFLEDVRLARMSMTGRGADADRGAERLLDGGLQWRVPNGRWDLLLSVNDRRSPRALPAGLPRPRLDADGHHADGHGAAGIEAAFQEYGLPWMMRSDNGPPFATTRIHGLSMARTSACTARSSAARSVRRVRPCACDHVRATMGAQHRAVHACRTEFNEERPHESLGMVTPASVYTPSPRPYPARLPVPEHPGHCTVKKITTGGTFRFGNRVLYLANALTGEIVGLDEVDDGLWHLHVNTVLSATLDERDYIIRARPERVTHVAGRKCYPCTRAIPGAKYARQK